MGVALDLKPSYHLKGTTKQRKSRACAAGDRGDAWIARRVDIANHWLARFP